MLKWFFNFGEANIRVKASIRYSKSIIYARVYEDHQVDNSVSIGKPILGLYRRKWGV
jgi:hypothetical protein